MLLNKDAQTARTASKTKNCLAQNGNSAEAEKLWQSLNEQVDSKEACSASYFPYLRSAESQLVL